MFEVNSTDRLQFTLKMHQVDYNEQSNRALKKEIAEKYGVPVKNVSINFVPITVDKDGKSIPLTSEIITNIQNPAFQIGLCKEYLDMKGITDVDFERIKEIDSQVNAFVDFDSYSKYKSYKFKYVKWSNYLSYGKSNYFDFSDLHGLVLLNGEPENQSGKTTFAIDLLRFALFGRSKKSPDLNSVFNIYHPEETEVIVEACLEIEGQDYVIRRTVTRPSLAKRTERSKPKQKVEYFRLVNGEYEADGAEVENNAGENTSETNNIIRESVGNVEDYNLVISATSKTLSDLLDMGQTEKGKLFSRWLGLLTLEQKEAIAKDLWKKSSQRLLSNTYDKTTIESEIKDYGVVKGDKEKTISEEEKKLSDSRKRIEKLNSEKTKVLSQKKAINEEISGIDLQTVENQIKYNSDELETQRLIFKKHKEDYILLKSASFNEEDVVALNAKMKGYRDELLSLTAKNAEIKANIGAIRNDTKRIEELKTKGKCPTCGHKIEMSEQDGFIESNLEKEKVLIEEGVQNKNKIDGINAEIAKVEAELKEQEEKKNKVNERTKLELKLTALKATIENFKLVIADLEKKKGSIVENAEAIKYNQDIDLSVRNIDISIANETNISEGHIKMIESCKTEIISIDKEVEKRKELLAKLTEEAKFIREWTIYQELMGKNGIVKIVLKRALPIINNEIARILDGICDFDVILSVADDGKVHIDLVRGGVKLDLGIGASGFESVVSSLAIRSALATVSSLPKSRNLVLDEILDGVAVSNYDNVRELYNRIIKNYDFILHITHNEMIADWHDTVITVTKDLADNTSKIEKSRRYR